MFDLKPSDQGYPDCRSENGPVRCTDFWLRIFFGPVRGTDFGLRVRFGPRIFDLEVVFVLWFKKNMDHKPFEGEVFEVQVLLRHYLCPFLIPMVTNDKINSLFYLVTHHSWNWFFRKTMTLWINKLFKKYLWEYEENIIDGDPVVTSAAENRIETILSIKWIRVGRKWNVTWLYKPCHWTQKSKIGQRWPWNWSKRNSSPTGYGFLIWVKNFDFLSKKSF